MGKDRRTERCSLPRKKEGWVVRMNAIKALTNIMAELDANRHVIVPYIVIDNDLFMAALTRQMR